MADLLGGQIQCMFLDMTSALSQLQAGKLRALAVAPARRVPVLPDIPSIAEQGYPGFDIHAWYGLMDAEAGPEVGTCGVCSSTGFGRISGSGRGSHHPGTPRCAR